MSAQLAVDQDGLRKSTETCAQVHAALAPLPAVLADAVARLRSVAGQLDEAAPRLDGVVGVEEWTGAAAERATAAGRGLAAGLRDVGGRASAAADVMAQYEQDYAGARQRLQRIAGDRAEAGSQLRWTERQLSLATDPQQVAVLAARRDELGTVLGHLDGRVRAVLGDLAAVQSGTAARLRQLTPETGDGDPTLVAQALSGATDTAVYNTRRRPKWPPWATLFPPYSKSAHGRDDYGGHKVYFQIPEVTKSRDGKWVYLKGQVRASAYAPGLPVPSKIFTSDTITVKKNDETGQSFSLGWAGGPTGGYGSTWQPVRAGNAFKVPYPHRKSVWRNFTAAIPLDGTHLGDFFGDPPTGRRVTWTETRWARWQDGRVVEHWANTDALGMLRQLGLVQPTARDSW
jgi:hypothetical protein